MAATAQQQPLLQQSQQQQQQPRSMPHGLGLLTTVASLPPKYRSRYLNIKTKCEIPLDLSVKPTLSSPQIVNDVPIATTFTEVCTEPYSTPAPAEQVKTNELRLCETEVRTAATATATRATVTITQINHTEHMRDLNTPPISPTSPKKRKYGEHLEETVASAAAVSKALALTESAIESYTNPAKLPKTAAQPTTKRECTPTKPIKPTDSAPKTIKAQAPNTKAGRNKATRKLKFDEETSSPVSGTIIRPLEDITDGSVQYSNGDIDPKYNIVEITEETKAELAAIKNVIGDYICRLCRLKFDDAFGLARHRCACIVLLEYRCPECGKQFNCPANLASHRRWHKPKKETGAVAKKENRNTSNTPKAPVDDLVHKCGECGKHFKRQAYLRKHQLTHDNKSKRVLQSPPLSDNAAAVGQTTAYEASSGSSSVHSYSGGTQEDEGVYAMYEADCLSDCSSNSSSSAGYGRLQIVENPGLTEEENIAAAALTNLRNCASVIQHTTFAH